MDEYISKEKIIAHMKKESLHFFNSYYKGYMEAINEIIEFEAADVQPSVHGYWEECRIRGTLTQSCSVCGNDCGVLYPYNFCPNCGARMDGDTE